MAALKRLEEITERETSRAVSLSGAPETVQTMALLAPSPSAAMRKESFRVTKASAAAKAS